MGVQETSVKLQTAQLPSHPCQGNRESRHGARNHATNLSGSASSLFRSAVQWNGLGLQGRRTVPFAYSQLQSPFGREPPSTGSSLKQAPPCHGLFEQLERAEASWVEEERGVHFLPLSQKFRVDSRGEGESAGRSTLHSESAPGQSASNAGVNWEEQVPSPAFGEDDQNSERRTSHFHASSSNPQVKANPPWLSRCEGPPPLAAQSFLTEVQTDLRGFDTPTSVEELNEGLIFERDEEWEASVFLWKRPRGSQREVGSVFAGTPGPAFQGDNRRYFVEDTGKQLRIKRLGKRDKQGPKRAEREHKRELERRWLEEKYGLTLPETKGVKNVVNRIGGWKVVGQGWVERRRDTEIAKIAKSVGMERAIERDMRERRLRESGLVENGVKEEWVGIEADEFGGVWLRRSEGAEVRGDNRALSEEGSANEFGVNDPQGRRRDGNWSRSSDSRSSGARERGKISVSEVIALDQRRGSSAKVLQSTGAGNSYISSRIERNESSGLNHRGREEKRDAQGEFRKEVPVEPGDQRRLYQKGPAFARLQNEGSAEEVERFARRAFLEHMETKYGKLHVGRLWKESKIEDTRGWLQVRRQI